MRSRGSVRAGRSSSPRSIESPGCDMYDWRADVRARLSTARLHPQDEAEIVEEIAQHLEAQFAELALKVGETEARAQLLAQLNDDRFDDVVRRRRRAEPTSTYAY